MPLSVSVNALNIKLYNHSYKLNDHSFASVLKKCTNKTGDITYNVSIGLKQNQIHIVWYWWHSSFWLLECTKKNVRNKFPTVSATTLSIISIPTYPLHVASSVLSDWKLENQSDYLIYTHYYTLIFLKIKRKTTLYKHPLNCRYIVPYLILCQLISILFIINFLW